MIKIKNMWLVAGIGLALAGCNTKKYLDINTNPNALTASTPEYVFTAAANRTGAIITPNETGEYWSGHWTQSSTYAYSATTFSYQFNNTNFNFWDTWYDVAEDYQYVIDNADASKMSFFKGPAKIMKAYIFHSLVDCYGNVPYSDAFKGVASIAPKFDDQKAIYESLITLLDSGIANTKANAFTGSFGSNDIVFKGDRTKWVRFANTLKLRLLIRQSRIAGRDTYIKTEINKILSSTTEGFIIEGQDVGVNPGFVASSGQINPIYNNWGYSETGAVRAIARYPRPTKFLFDQMIALNDTFRLKRLAYAKGGENGNNPGVSTQPEILTNYVGVPFGTSSGSLAQNTSYIGPSFVIKGQFAKDVILMTAAESFFLQAEAKQLYGTGVTLASTPQAYYETGVKEAFRITGTAAANATVLLTSGKDLADWAASTDKLKAIWFQKWLALTNFSGLEAWADYRRTNYPVLPASVTAPTAKPNVRLFYPASELAANTANVTAQGAIDVTTSRLFWDVD
jgi:hypothetical protein